MITIKLTEADISYIIDEMCNANDAERYYLNDEFNNIDPDEEKEMSEAIDARSKIIGKLDRALQQAKKGKK